MKNWDFRFRHSYLLRGHHKHVNALALTPQGNILASGGEDGRLLLWDTFGLDNKPFKSMLTQYDGPILTVAVDCKGQRVYSAGKTRRILFHDLQSGKESSIEESKVCKVRTHTTNPEIFAATFCWLSGRGRPVRLYDTRVGKHIAEIIPEHSDGKSYGHIEGLAINPVDPNYFLVGSDFGAILIDMRNLGDIPITEYLSPYQKFGYSNCSDIKFLPDGSRFVACYQRHFPALYSIHSNNPTCIFYGFEYSNYTTTKSLDVAVWGNSTYVIAGSDYKKIYTWRVPANLSLPEGGVECNFSLDGTIFEWNDGNRVQMIRLPYQSISSCHRGNVNHVLFNSELNCLYASSMANAIVLHTPYRLCFHEEKVWPSSLTWEDEEYLRYYENNNSNFLSNVRNDPSIVFLPP